MSRECINKTIEYQQKEEDCVFEYNGAKLYFSYILDNKNCGHYVSIITINGESYVNNFSMGNTKIDTAIKDIFINKSKETLKQLIIKYE